MSIYAQFAHLYYLSGTIILINEIKMNVKNILINMREVYNFSNEHKHNFNSPKLAPKL